MHQLFLLLCIFGSMPAYSIVISKNTSFLIIGSSVPAIVTGLILSHYNVSVTISYKTENIDNLMSTITKVVNGKTYELPKMQPVIYENSELSQNLISYLGMDLHAENGFSISFQNHSSVKLSTSDSFQEILAKLVKVGCISAADQPQMSTFMSELQNYNYTLFRSKFSSKTLEEFAKFMKAPDSFMNCALDLLTINTGMNKTNFNAADAIGRIEFYLFNTNSPLRSYYVKGQTNTGKPIKGLMDQIIDHMKSRNVKFIANHTTTEFNVNVNTAIILGDLSDTSITYDFVILGDTLDTSKNILQTTCSGNSGTLIDYRMHTILKSMSEYSSNSDVASIKIWLSKRIWLQPHIIQVNNSPFPSSIQSINQLTLTSIPTYWDTVLEVIVVGTNVNGAKSVDLNKVFRELLVYLPDIKMNEIITHRIDWVDMGVIMDTKYGSSRLNTDSMIRANISNLIFAGDWLDAVNSTASGLERSIEIALQTVRNMTFN